MTIKCHKSYRGAAPPKNVTNNILIFAVAKVSTVFSWLCFGEESNVGE